MVKMLKYCTKRQYASLRNILTGIILIWIPFLNTLSQSPIKILPLGNSITYDAREEDSRSTGDKISYRYKLYTLLTQNGYNIDFVGSYRSGYNYFDDCENSGFPGIDTKNLADLVETGTSAFTGKIVNGPYLSYYPADIILLEIGTNDVLAGKYTVEHVSRLLDAVDDYEQLSGNPILVIVGTIISRLNYPCGTHGGTTLFNNNLVSMVQSRIASGDKLILVDMECGAGINYFTDMWDNLHPSPTGYDKMGQKWYITIEAINAVPVVNNIPDQTRAEGSNFATINLDGYVSDPDDPDADITWTTVPADPDHFTVTINQDRIATITPKDENWNGSESIVFVATDPGKFIPAIHSSDQDEVTFTVTPVNDPPVIASQKTTPSFDEDTYLDILLSYLNVTDVDNPLSELNVIVQSGTNYTYSGARVFPEPDFNGSLTVNIVVSDGETTSNTFGMHVNVNPLNDKPVIVSTPDSVITVNEFYEYDILATDVDENDELIYNVPTKPAWLSFNSGLMQLTGMPELADIGESEVVVQVSDGNDITEQRYKIHVMNYSGLEDYNGDSDLVLLYPSPARNQFTVISHNGNIHALFIYDLAGGLRNTIVSDGLHDQLTVSDLDLAWGIYVVKTTTDKGICFAKLLIEP